MSSGLIVALNAADIRQLHLSPNISSNSGVRTAAVQLSTQWQDIFSTYTVRVRIYVNESVCGSTVVSLALVYNV